MFICKMTEALTARGAWERLEGYLGIRQVKQESEEIMPSVPYMYRHKIILFPPTPWTVLCLVSCK